MNKQFKADMALLFVTFGWGMSFMLTKYSLLHLQAFNLLATRFLAAFIIASVIFIKKMIKIDKKTILYGMGIGFVLFVSYAFQTVGLYYTTASKSAFITGFAVVLVPLMLAFINKKRLNIKSCVSAIIAFAGLALLTLNKSITDINIGDVYTFISSVLGAYYLILAGRYTVKVESITFAITQVFSVGFFSLVLSFVIEKPVITGDRYTWASILILSIICTAGAMIIQMEAQKHTSPAHTALIFTAEPAFAGLFGFLFFKEMLGLKGIIGALLILLGMLMSEVDLKGILRVIERKINPGIYCEYRDEIEITD